MMNRMAVGADHVVDGVGGAADIGARKRLAVAFQAGIQHLLLGNFRERENRARLRESFDVIFPGPMAALTPGTLGRFLAGDDALIVGILKKGVGDFLMTRRACLAAHELTTGFAGYGLWGGLTRLLRLRGKRSRKERAQHEQQKSTKLWH